MLQKVVFLDRDGVINRDSADYIKSWAEFEFIPGSVEAIELLIRHHFIPIVITNQSALGRNLITHQKLETMHARMQAVLEARGGKIEDIYFCPHLPAEGCECRKPKPGLLYQARDAHGIDLSQACMIGDSARDIQCARRAGCGLAVLVETGNGRTALRELAEQEIIPDFVVADLYGAVNWLIAR